MDHRCYLYLITMGRYDQNGSTMDLSKWIYDLLLSWKLTGPEVSEETCLIPGGPIAMLRGNMSQALALPFSSTKLA